MKDMKKLIFALTVMGVSLGLGGCKYDDSYLDVKLSKTMAYFASYQEYTRTVIVGEGMKFKIGAAMAGAIKNPVDQTVDLKIVNYTLKSISDARVQLPTSMFKVNGSPYVLGTNIRTIIPAGQFLGFFEVALDSTAFLADPSSLTNKYTLRVKIASTSLDSIKLGYDSVDVTVKYQASVDGFYLNQSVIKKEFPAGTFVDAKQITDNYLNETDNSAWRLLTKGPYKVEATSPVTSAIKGNAGNTAQIKFNLTMNADNTFTYESIAGQPVITPVSTNTYNSKTRDFTLNYSYKKTGTPVNDTIYHVTTKMIFRNRMVDAFNQTRDYLQYLNK